MHFILYFMNLYRFLLYLIHMSLIGVLTRKPSERRAELNRGLHEPWHWYDNCKTRTRNKGK